MMTECKYKPGYLPYLKVMFSRFVCAVERKRLHISPKGVRWA
jgi:hypothetical protein